MKAKYGKFLWKDSGKHLWATEIGWICSFFACKIFLHNPLQAHTPKIGKSPQTSLWGRPGRWNIIYCSLKWMWKNSTILCWKIEFFVFKIRQNSREFCLIVPTQNHFYKLWCGILHEAFYSQTRNDRWKQAILCSVFCLGSASVALFLMIQQLHFISGCVHLFYDFFHVVYGILVSIYKKFCVSKDII